MSEKKYVLGIDTSNYKTSIALTDRKGNVLCDLRKFLTVKPGERGLRQSEALFQHVKVLPELMGELAGTMESDFGQKLAAVACSTRPRPVEGSYMPCFLAGQSMASAIASALNLPLLEYSHQEGHIEAVKHSSPVADKEELLACHFSGGTCEVLKFRQKQITADSAFELEIAGGSRDISFGQVLDRAGVAMGMAFPCGAEMDIMAENAKASSSVLTAIKVKDAWLNLSGIDTQIKNAIGKHPEEELIREIFDKSGRAIADMILQASEKTGMQEILISGGVSSSRYIRRILGEELSGLSLHFGENDLSSDNAVGIAFLGGNYIWD